MYNSDQTLLPKTATGLAKAMDLLEERLFQLPVEMVTKDPMKVSGDLLDHLAWENSVDAWDTDWPEAVKRNVVAVSAELHRYKGTPYGIKLALMAFGVDVDLVEWWEVGGSGVPGTFVARSFVTDPLDGSAELSVTGPVISAMKAMLNGVSPVSRTWALEIGIRSESKMFAGAFPTTLLKATADYRIDPPPVSVASSSAAVIQITQIKSTVTTV